MLMANSGMAADNPPVLPDPELYKQVAPLSPEDAMAALEVPDGDKLELVASEAMICEAMIREPMIREPMIREAVLCVWDGNGRMYVAQMDSYMQDADATGESNPTSRVLRLNNNALPECFQLPKTLRKLLFWES